MSNASVPRPAWETEDAFAPMTPATVVLPVPLKSIVMTFVGVTLPTSVSCAVVVSMRPLPSGATVRFGRSPACEPCGFSAPCCLFSGLK